MTRQPLSLAEHQTAGHTICKFREALIGLQIRLPLAYGKQHRTVQRARRALRALEVFRSSLDDCVCSERPEDDAATEIYYRGAGGDHDHDDDRSDAHAHPGGADTDETVELAAST